MLVVALSFAVDSVLAATSSTTFEKPTTSLQPEEVWFGHNVSQTTFVLPRGNCSAGLQVVACGVTDQISVATSPFIWANYILPNAYLRLNPGGPNGSYSFQLAQIGDGVHRHSYGSYDMSTTYGWATRRWFHSSQASLYTSLIGAYYWSDEIPFSLRRPQPEVSPWQFSITNLASVRLLGPVFLNGEFGILGMNEYYPHLHFGASVAYRSGNLSAHLGISVTSTWSAIWSENKNDYWMKNRRQQASNRFSSDVYGTDFLESPSRTLGADLANDLGTHPEFSLQLYF